jgi:polyhydroxyalkanoate synthase
MIEAGRAAGRVHGCHLLLLTPIRSMTKYNLDLLEVVDNEAKLINYLRMEKWLADRPHHAGEAAKQWLKFLPGQQADQERARARWAQGGPATQVTMPVLNIYAQDDHIVPPPTSRALEQGRQRRLYRARYRAGISACSSPASRKASSAGGSSTGWLGATAEQREHAGA